MSRSQSAHGKPRGPISSANERSTAVKPSLRDGRFLFLRPPPTHPLGRWDRVFPRPMRGLVGYRRLWQARALWDGVQGALFDALVSHQPDVRPRLGSVVGDAVFFIGGLGYIGGLCLRFGQPMRKQWLPVMA